MLYSLQGAAQTQRPGARYIIIIIIIIMRTYEASLTGAQRRRTIQCQPITEKLTVTSMLKTKSIKTR